MWKARHAQEKKSERGGGGKEVRNCSINFEKGQTNEKKAAGNRMETVNEGEVLDYKKPNPVMGFQ